MNSDIYDLGIFLLFRFSILSECLFFRHFSKVAEKQGKFVIQLKLSADLSTVTVDVFSLALLRGPLQAIIKNHIFAR